MNWRLIEVRSKKDQKNFINVNVQLNCDNPNYIRPLDKDINALFDPRKNKHFKNGTAIRWLLTSPAGEYVGRIAAFVNKKYKNKDDDIPVGGIGFFDCINDQSAANMLFDVAKDWLTTQNMQAMDGPINFGDRDSWWGLVIDGFQEPAYHMNYNPPYYKNLFETYGFQVFFNQLCFGMPVKQALSPKLIMRHEQIKKDSAYSAKPIVKKELGNFARDFAEVYNAAWSGHGGLKEISHNQAIMLFKKMKPVMDERLVWFAYYQNRPIAIFINLPDLNQWFKYLNGKFSIWHQLKFLFLKKYKPCKRFLGLVFGVIPEFQSKGVDAYIIVEAANFIQPSVSYSEYEMQWIGDFNPKMVNIASNLSDTTCTRKLATYRYLFDRTKEFKRHPIVS